MDDILGRLSALTQGMEGGMPLPVPYDGMEGDPEVALLYALRPLLTGARGAKLEEAVRLLRLMKMVPGFQGGDAS